MASIRKAMKNEKQYCGAKNADKYESKWANIFGHYQFGNRKACPIKEVNDEKKKVCAD
jgi:hypothetical protein